jgi:hypothetical protein
MKKTVFLLIFSIICLFVQAQTTQSVVLNETTWSYSERMYGMPGVEEVTSYFAFVTPTKVIWLFGTPNNNVFPVGIGTHDAKNGTITFPASYPPHKQIMLYDDDNTIIFSFHVSNGQATMVCKDKESDRFFNDGQPFKLNKEKYSLKPNHKLVGTSWGVPQDDGHGYKGTLYFKSEYEVMINGKTHLYVCLGNSVSIKTGDNLDDENLVGIYNSQSLELYREGIKAREIERCFPIKRIE